MKTRTWIITGLAIALIALIGLVPAATMAQGRGPGTGPGTGPGNGSGVCSGVNFVDDDGDGVCDNAGTGRGSGARRSHRP